MVEPLPTYPPRVEPGSYTETSALELIGYCTHVLKARDPSEGSKQTWEQLEAVLTESQVGTAADVVSTARAAAWLVASVESATGTAAAHVIEVAARLYEAAQRAQKDPPDAGYRAHRHS